MLSATPQKSIDWRNRKVLVTGGLGFIGSNLVRRLDALGARVLVVDNLLPGHGGDLANLDGASNRVRIELLDLRDASVLPALVQDQQTIFNLAGQTSHQGSMTDPQTDLSINATAQLHLLEACRAHAPETMIVYASTRQVYGVAQSLPVDESHSVNPVDVNGFNKLAGEGYHLLYSRVYGLATSALRLTNTFGPRMRVCDAKQTFLGIWISSVLRGEPFEVWGGEQLRDLTYVDDAVDAFLAAAEPSMAGRFYNVGGCPPVSLLELADTLVQANGSGQYVVREFPAARRRIDVGDYYADDKLLRSLTGWHPKVSLRQGLAQTLEYFRQPIAQSA
jgi:UDP-glucose 4-epimerase